MSYPSPQRRTPAVALLALALAGLAEARPQEPLPDLGKLMPPAGSARQFGSSVAAGGELLLVGAIDQVFAWRLQGGVLTAEGPLVPALVRSGNQFGCAMDLDGALAAVGARLDDPLGTSSGSVVILFHGANGWEERQRLVAPDGRPYDQFGAAVAVSGDRVLVGSPLADLGGTNRGAAYVFRDSGAGLVLEATLQAADGSAVDRFGAAVALSGDRAVVGAPGHDEAGADAGAAYEFRFDGTAWQEVQELRAPDTMAGDHFGSALDLDATRLLVGAPDHGAGAAELFQESGGALVHQAGFAAADGAAGDRFGGAVALSATHLAVGAEGQDALGNGSGATYVFSLAQGTWDAGLRHEGPDTSYGDRFGHAVAFGAGSLLVGADLEDDAGLNAGAGYVFAVPEPEPEAQDGLRLTATMDRGVHGRHFVDLELSGGEPRARALLVIVAHEGRPMFRVLSMGRFDGQGRLVRRVYLPWNLRRALTLSLQGFQDFRRKCRVASPVVEVTLEPTPRPWRSHWEHGVGLLLGRRGR